MNKQTLRDDCYIIHLFTPNVRYSKEQLQDLYTNTAKTHDYSYSVFKDEGSAEFRITDQRTPEQTKYIFDGSTVLLVHESVGKIGLEHFLERANDLISNAIKYLKIPLFIQQNSVIRCNASPFHTDDSRRFILESVCSLKEERLKSFGRLVHGVGLRFFFPPMQDKLYQFDIKIESLLKDPRVLYLECMGSFFQPIQVSTLDMIKENMHTTKDFIYNNISDFLEQFNKKEG